MKTLGVLSDAAKNGDSSAAFILGQMFEKGWGTGQSQKNAAQWYLRAAKAGNTSAYHFVACAYYFGTGLKRDLNRAFFWFCCAAEVGDLDAAYMQAVCMYEGSGTRQDRKLGLQLLTACAKRRSQDAMLYLANIALQRHQRRRALLWAERAKNALS